MPTENFAGKWTEYQTAVDVNKYISQLEAQVSELKSAAELGHNYIEQLVAESAQLTAERDAAQCAIAEAASTFNKSLCAGCDTLLAQASETQGEQVEIVELQAQVDALTAQLAEAEAKNAELLRELTQLQTLCLRAGIGGFYQRGVA